MDIRENAFYSSRPWLAYPQGFYMIFAFKTTVLGLFGIAFIATLIIRLRGQAQADVNLGLAALGLLTCGYIFFDHSMPVFPGSTLPEILDSRSLISSFWWLNVAFLANALVKRFVYRRRLTRDGEPTIPLLLQHLARVLIYLLATMIVIRFVYGQSITAIAAASGAVALALGYASRMMLNEIFAGLALNINAPFEKGDLIQMNDEWGYIKDISWRSITYIDMDQNYVVVPNTVVAASKIRNLDQPSVITRRTFVFRAEYNIPPKVVIEQCELSMSECPHIIPHPWNFVSFLGFDESGMKYKVHFHINHYDDWYVASDELVNAIWYRFARVGIRFAHQRGLNFTSAEDEKRGLPNSAFDESSWRDLIERFKHVPMFEGMTKDDMEELAKSAAVHIVGPPERIIRAGSSRTSMFMVASGSADVYAVDQDGVETWMATIGESECLGLMSLLTGEPQRTTIRAKVEAVVWEISSESLHALFEHKPGIMESIAKNVAEWQVEEQEALSLIAMNRQQEVRMIKTRANSLSNRITKFFNRRKADESSSEYAEY